MSFNSRTVLTKQFTRNILGGYSSKEVGVFLQDISEELQKHDSLNKKLTNTICEKESYITECRERESILRDAILTAQKTADQIKKMAQKEARFIVEDAEKKATLIIQDARDSLKTTYQDLSNLQKIHIQLKHTLKAVLNSHHELLDQHPVHSFLPSSFQNQKVDSPIEKKISHYLNKAVKSKDSL